MSTYPGTLDCSNADTARLRNSRVITGDRAWLQVAESLGLQITVFRPPTQ